MNVALRKPMTLEEFLGWEERPPTRFEFDGFHPVAMTGGTIAHNRIMRRLHRALERRLEGQPREPFGPDVKVIVDSRARYPDAVVTCTPQTDSAQVIDNPVVVFEVLSDSTSRTDRIDKVREYQATQSILRYIILEQDSAGATVFERQDAGWMAATLTERDRLLMPEIGIEIPLAELYADPRRPAAQPHTQPD
ncbi:MAG TPA: Uma2 family endonuclease [Acetobacteraceae bacterium]|jgi:Uma2 family endonuclease